MTKLFVRDFIMEKVIARKKKELRKSRKNLEEEP